MLLVSHDRAVLDAVARRTLAIEDGTVREYDGGWAEYARVVAERDLARGQTPDVSETSTPPRAPRQQPPRPRRQRELERIEAEIEAKELEVHDLERRLAEDWSNLDTAAAYRHAREELDTLLSRWEALLSQATVE